MKLIHVSFAGVDEKTNIEDLYQLQMEYPFIEFGILISKNWTENGNRYFNPDKIYSLKGDIIKLHLSLHVCGSLTDFAHKYDSWDNIDDFIGNNLRIFQRVQLNVSKRDKPFYSISPIINQEIIIQQKDKDHIGTFLSSRREWVSHSKRFSLLLDASGGNGIDTPIEILDNFFNDFKVGYAGGINPDNVERKLIQLSEYPSQQYFWIDMESGVRTEDWFDLSKVEKVCQIADKFYKGT